MLPMGMPSLALISAYATGGAAMSMAIRPLRTANAVAAYQKYSRHIDPDPTPIDFGIGV